MSQQSEKREDLEEAYQGAVYRAGFPGGKGKQFFPGKVNPEIDRLVHDLVHDEGCQSWCFITASNPGSAILSEQENSRRNSDLYSLLDNLGFPNIPAYSEGENWPVEKGCLVFCIDLEDALRLTRLYNQSAVLFARKGDPAKIVFV